MAYLDNDEKIFAVFALDNDLLTIFELNWLEGIGHGESFPFVK